MGQRGQRAGAGAALVAGDRDMVGARLRDAGRDRADPDFRHQFHRYVGARVGVFQIVDQLRQILDRIDVVVRRRRDQPDPRRRIAHAGDRLVDLAAGQLTALAGLGALRHLDLQDIGVDEVLGRDAEPARGDLLDRRAHRVAVRQRLEALGLLAALAGVRLAADAVHRDRQRRVRLAADRAEAHRAGREAPDDVGCRLDLVERHRLIGRAELHQPADRQQPLALVVDRRREGLVVGERIAAHRVLQSGDALRRPGMRLAAQPERIVAAEIEHLAIERVVAIGARVADQRLLGDRPEVGALDRRRGAGEVFLDKIALQPDRIEDLRAAIGLIGRDPHLGDDLQNALAERLQVILLDLLGRQRQTVLGADLLEGREGEIRVDRLGAIAGQHAEMMHLARLAGLDDDAGLGAQPLPDQVVVHRRGREQGRDRHPLGRHGAVGQDQDVVPGFDRCGRLGAEAVERRADAVRPFGGRPGDVERIGLEAAVDQTLDIADFREIGVGQDRLRDFEPVMRADLVAQEVRPRPDHRDQRHHQFLADRVDRRVGDLREILLEIVVEQLRPVRQRGDRRVGAHRADGVVALLRHRLEEELDVLGRVAEGLLQIEPGRGIVRHRRDRALGRIGKLLELPLRLFQPGLVRVLGGELPLDLVVADDAAFLEVDQQHFPRLQPPFADDLFLRDRQHAALRGEDHMIVVGDDVAGGPEAVAVQRRADLAAVGEGDRRRPVPRLHQRRVIFVEGAPRSGPSAGRTTPPGSASSSRAPANSRRR